MFFAAIALALGGYYFFGQYILAKKAYEIGLWKDCHDRDVGLTAVVVDKDLIDPMQDIANTSVCHRLSKISYDNIAKRWSQLASSGAGAKRGINDCLTIHVFLAVLSIFGWLLLTGALVFHGLAVLCDCCFDRAAGIGVSGICYFVFWGLLIAVLTMSQGGFYTFSIALGMVVFLNEHLVRSHPINKAIAAARREYDDHCRGGHGYLDEETYYRAWVNMRNEGYRQGVPSPLTASLDGFICNPLFLFGLDFAIIMFPTATVLRTTIRSGFPRSVREILDSSWHIASPTMLVFFTALCLCGGSFLRPTNRTTIDREAQADRIETISHKSLFLSRMLSILDNITTSRRKDRILDPKKLL